MKRRSLKLSTPCLILCFIGLVMSWNFVGRIVINGLFLVLAPQEALNTGVFHGDIREMSAALDYGADVNHQGSYAGRTPLMIAAIHGQVAVTRFLLAHGADPTMRDQKGLTAMQLAQKENQQGVLQLLTASQNTH